MKIHKTILSDSKGNYNCYEFLFYEKSNQIVVKVLKVEETIEYTIDLNTYSCSCPSRKQPCKHLLEVPFVLIEKSDTSPEAALNEDFYKETQ